MLIHFTHRVAGTVPPLETDDGSKKSDHKVAFASASIPHASPFKWLSYSYRYYNKDSSKKFGGWLARKDWRDVVTAKGAMPRPRCIKERSMPPSKIASHS